MIYTYTAVFSPMEDGSGYYCRVPDLPGCITTGKDLSDAVEQITDAMSGWLCVAEDSGIEIAPPTDPLRVPHEDGDICTLVRADVTQYRAMTDSRAVRKTVSLPQWMVLLADRMGINCSQILQEALRERFGTQAKA